MPELRHRVERVVQPAEHRVPTLTSSPIVAMKRSSQPRSYTHSLYRASRRISPRRRPIRRGDDLPAATPQIRAGFLGGPERMSSGVARRWEEGDAACHRSRSRVGVQLLIGESGTRKCDRRPGLSARRHPRGRPPSLRFPDSLGQPESLGGHAKAATQCSCIQRICSPVAAQERQRGRLVYSIRSRCCVAQTAASS